MYIDLVCQSIFLSTMFIRLSINYTVYLSLDVYHSHVYHTGVCQTGVYQTGVYHTGVYQMGVYHTGIYQTGVYHRGLNLWVYMHLFSCLHISVLTRCMRK